MSWFDIQEIVVTVKMYINSSNSIFLNNHDNNIIIIETFSFRINRN